ncbi:DUF11 domain-containing protein [Phytomonospora endophytica]|uniref:LPXTG-motif cell wall-anchored protein n=1 Tax=Phytomonospora endophytica TaxID=714109 RepID=A0A841FMK5_9ACTN|nr:DUF11 domain-containing protein [Phytomonospora endophytica]MBB6037084.1 LPXTG-motif cell wall-anchored protein [Phytomonospora endophytica]GIG69374.1 hypothetical protein Pen01_56690 [Phytomonospora endophytica]
MTALFALSAPAYADPDPSTEPAASGEPTVAPAPADPDVKPMATGADLSVKVRSSESTPGGAANVRKMITVEVKNKGPEPAKNPVVTFAIKDYDPSDGYELTGAGDFCDTAPTPATGDVVFTCDLSDKPDYALAPGAVSNLAFLQLEHGIGAEGDVVEGVASVESETPDDDEKNNSAPFTITVVDAGVDVSAYIGTDMTIDPGKTASFAGDGFVQVYNEGNTPIDGISLSLTLPAYASFEKDYGNCEYSADGRKANCSYDHQLAENQDGFAIADETPFRITVAKNAPGPLSIGDATATAAALGVLEPQEMRGAGSGQMLTKADEQDDQAPGDNVVSWAVFTTANPADVKVTSTEAEGKVGATVSVVVAVGNNGPADSPGGAEVTFTAPKGTSVVSAPDDCKEQSKGVWVCTTDATIPVGKENKGTFKLKIDGGTVEDGKAEVVARFADTDEKNNAAAVVVNVLSGGGGGLPVTGQNLTIAGIAAAVLLAVGGALVLLGRKRRAAVAEGPDGSGVAGAGPDAGAGGGTADAEEAAEEAAEAEAATVEAAEAAAEKAVEADEAAAAGSADADEAAAAAEEAEAEVDEAAAVADEKVAKAEAEEPAAAAEADADEAPEGDAGTGDGKKKK